MALKLSTKNEKWFPNFLHNTKSKFIKFCSQKQPASPNVLFFFPHTGVTDSKAVKGSSSMLDWSSYSETASPSHILVIVSGIAAGLVLTVLLVCLFVTCRRKVSCWLWILKRWQTMFPKKVRSLGPFWFLRLVLAVFLESWCLYPRNV